MGKWQGKRVGVPRSLPIHRGTIHRSLRLCRTTKVVAEWMNSPTTSNRWYRCGVPTHQRSHYQRLHPCSPQHQTQPAQFPWKLLSLPVKFGGIGLSNPTTTAERHHHRSSSCTSVLSDAIISTDTKWVYLDHYRHLNEMREEGQRKNALHHQVNLDRLTTKMTPKCKRSTLRSQSTGSWLSIIPSRVSGLSLSKEEFRDGIALRYGLNIPNLPKKCDSYGNNSPRCMPSHTNQELSCLVDTTSSKGR